MPSEKSLAFVHEAKDSGLTLDQALEGVFTAAQMAVAMGNPIAGIEAFVQDAVAALNEVYNAHVIAVRVPDDDAIRPELN